MSHHAAVDPSSLVADEEEANRVWQAAASLPEEQRMVLALRIHGDLTFKQIGQRENVSENTARSRYRYALEKLRQRFSGGDP